MLEEVVKDYSAYLKLDVSNGFQTVQDVVDNMLTRLEELTSVLQMIRSKNSECNTTVTEDIRKYRNEISILSKKIITLNDIVSRLHNNVDVLEKRVDKAEIDFGVNMDNKLRSFLKPFMKLSKENTPVNNAITIPTKLNFETVLNHFEDSES
jgi:predicted nuclease with TOPRIM domain